MEHSEGYESWDMMISASYDMNNGILYITPMHIYIYMYIYNGGYLWDSMGKQGISMGFHIINPTIEWCFRAVFVTILMGRKTWRLNHLKSI